MNIKNAISSRRLVLMALLLTSCSSAPTVKPELEFETPAEFVNYSDSGKSSDRCWVDFFGDERLALLIDEAFANNADLKAAAARLRAAKAGVAKAGAFKKPDLGIGAGMEKDKDLNKRRKSSFKRELSFNASWELDVWGRIAAEQEAADAEFRSMTNDYEYARRSLAAQTAKNWFYAAEARLHMQLSRSFVENYEKQLELVGIQVEMGDASPHDLNLIRADLASARQGHLMAEAEYEEVLRSIELLLGRYPAAEIDAADALPEITLGAPPCLPSDLLERRPDIIAARQRVEAAFRIKEAAVKARLPRFSLSSSIGGASSELEDIVSMNVSNAVVNLAANLLTPVYKGGSLAADVEIACAEQEVAAAMYAKTALNAFSEVESALSQAGSLKKRLEQVNQEVEESRAALERLRVQFEYGECDMLNVLQVQLRLNNARRSQLRLWGAGLERQINLFLALGGGFEESLD